MAIIKKGAKIAVIGDGGWGTTLGIMLCNQGYQVSVWGAFAEYLQVLNATRQNPKFLPGVKIPEGIRFCAEIREVTRAAELIVLAVPSKFLRQVLVELKDQDLSNRPVLSVVKGIEHNSLMRMSEVIMDVLGKVKMAVLSGPTISYEVARGIPSTCVVSSMDERLAEELQRLLMNEQFRVYTSPDVVGVELAGALKNIVAIACGISDGLGFGANTKAAILTRGLVEMARLGQAMGARPETFSGLSGVGDLVTTCISSHGRNRWVGEQIGKGRKLKQILAGMEMVAEGVETVKSAFELARRHKVEMPITSQMFAVLYEDKDPKLAVSELMLRQKKAE